MMMSKANNGFGAWFAKRISQFPNRSLSCEQNFCLKILAQLIHYSVHISLIRLELGHSRDTYK